MIGKIEVKDGLYVLSTGEMDNKLSSDRLSLAHIVTSIPAAEKDILLWHFRLGHPSFVYLERVLPQLFRNKKVTLPNCEVCQLAKHTRSTYSSIGYRPTKPFSVIHSDIWGPMRVKNLHSTRWFITFIDDHTRMTWTFLMKDKSETAHLFQHFYTMIDAQFHTRIQVLKTDNAKDYFNSILGSFLTEKGIVHASSCVETPQQNGIAERKNRHLLEVARACMFTHNVPQYLWGEAVLTATYLINRMPSKPLGYQTPRHILLQQYPHISSFLSDLPPRIFGCTAFVHVSATHRSKLEPRAIKCVFIGYSTNQKGYKCYSPSTKKLYNTRDVSFFEQQPYFAQTGLQGESSTTESQYWDLISIDALPTIPHEVEQESNSQGESSNELLVYTRRKKHAATETATEPEATEDKEEEVSTPPTDLDAPIAHRKGVRTCTTKYPIGNSVSYDRLGETYKGFLTSLDGIQFPNNVQEAMKQPQWKRAVEDELNALEKNKTWEVVKLPPNRHIVDCKWIFTVKYNADGTIERYKARLVARGFTQSYGVDYEETFAPVAKLNTVRVLMSLAVNLDWPLYQLDIKNAFLNGELAEEVYMKMPPGISTSEDGSVCRLRKALYGLKQSPRAWFERFTKVVKAGGYYQCQTDHTMFVKHAGSGKISILIVYVDDIVITGDDEEEITSLKKQLAKEFELKDLGELKYFLGIEVARSKKGIVLSQRKYILDLLNETGFLGGKPAETPMEQNKKLSRDGDIPSVEKHNYQRLVG
ncbi:Retrovirus-related Pol polyprotein from transposon TNT 1-94, partial [Linum perenne]